ncbi:MAG TPA: nucleotidyltransferase domain-containing protein [Methanomicrobia archaeon]|nr:nucleotidyltransferase domain-containing protein [Methanomicrobia archaeon]
MNIQIQKRYQKAVDEFVKRALEKYKDKIDSIILFGSVARGKAKEDSDIDILVIWNGKEAEGWRVMTGLAFDVLLDTGEYISIKLLRSGELEEKSPFEKKVIKEGIKIA